MTFKLPNIAYRVWDRALITYINARDTYRLREERIQWRNEVRDELQHYRNEQYDSGRKREPVISFAEEFASYLKYSAVVLGVPPEQAYRGRSRVVNCRCKGCNLTLLVAYKQENQCECGRVVDSILDAAGNLEFEL